MYDVIVIGAGPSGSSVANIVSKNGYNVLVLEKETFPRYHIGESLIPFTYKPLQKLDVIKDLQESNFIKKYSVQFVQQDGTEHKPFYFFDRYDKNTIAQTWQVDRSSFDNLLIGKAINNGAKVLYNKRVDQLIYKEGKVVGVKYTDINTLESCIVYSKWVVDASGRSALVSKAKNWQKNDPLLSNKMAIWTYYTDCERPEGIDAGATIVAFIENKGWFWYIPLANNTTSVGVVANNNYLMRNKTKDISTIFEKEVNNNIWLNNKLKNSTRVRIHRSTTDYSKYSLKCVDDGVVLVGDANAFLDPVFSSGVLLALKSGVMIGELLTQAFKDNNLNTKTFEQYSNVMNLSIENMRKLVYAFYNVNISFKDIIKQHPWVSDKITDCLSGDLEKDYSELWRVLV